MGDQFYAHRFQGTGVNMQISVTAKAAQFILTKDVGDGPVEGLAITFDRPALDQLRFWLGMAAENTAEPPLAPPAAMTPAMTPAMTLEEQIERMAAEQALSDVEQEAKVR